MMVRKILNEKKMAQKDKIVWRSHEPHRIEAFSDAVFAFAVSLLVISLEVPKSSTELLQSMKGFFPFVCCFAIIFYIWYEQYIFFRRFGLHDTATMFLNAALIIVVLFYVYPLKFVFNLWLIRNGTIDFEHDLVPLLCVYHGGFTGIYLLFTAMYHNAYKKRERLQLTPVEVFETRTAYFSFLGITLVGVLLLLITIFSGKYAFISTTFYGVIGIVMSVVTGKRAKLFRKKFGDVPMDEPHLGEE